jgi:hypothetical protein
MNGRRKYLILVFIFSGSFVFGQDVENENVSPSDTIGHSPKRAALYSTLLPGAGQVYNHINMPKGKRKAFWKVPLIYGGLGATGYLMVNNHLDQRRIREEYLFRSNNPGETLYSQYDFYDNLGLITLRQQRVASRDLMLFAFIGVYGFNVLDAFIEAHFVEFEVTPDLTFQARPKVNEFGGVGVSLSFNFR